ncbi:MAG TPA: NAD(P)H-hydrate dehydratase [Gemmatimonadales bacterium]|nr:NAD(P)H-hydrate dehydratase [Gemmatimonadales bacterium]
MDAAQAAAWDERARATAKIPSRVLMESAGRAAAQVLAAEFGQALGHGVLVAAGHGNNGGDGWVLARALAAAGASVWAAEAPGKRAPDCAANRALALASGVALVDGDEPWPDCGVLVDALLGTGAAGAPRGGIAHLVRRLAAHGAPVTALDGPTGLDLSTGVAHQACAAALTITFGGVRRGHLLGRAWCGKVVVVDIGFPPADPGWPILVDDARCRAHLPGFDVDMHKGRRGRVLVLGGDQGMAGAALHAARAALEAGAGLVKLAAHPASVAAAQAAAPDVLTVPTALGPSLEPSLNDALDWADAVVLGPGLGRGPDRTALVRAVVERCKAPLVLDADALHAGPDVVTSGRAPRVFTPHQAEFGAAFPRWAKGLEADRFGACRAAAAALPRALATPVASALLLKGVPTVLCGADGGCLVVASGNPALATGGSGDLLAGLVGAFLARGVGPLDAAALGAQVLGRGAELAADQLTVRGTRPADVLAALPALWRRWAQADAPRPPVLLTLDPPQLT